MSGSSWRSVGENFDRFVFVVLATYSVNIKVQTVLISTKLVIVRGWWSIYRINKWSLHRNSGSYSYRIVISPQRTCVETDMIEQ